MVAFVLGGALGWGTTAAWWSSGGARTADTGVTAGDVVAHPDAFVGDEVSVTGQIASVDVRAVPVTTGHGNPGARRGGPGRAAAPGAGVGGVGAVGGAQQARPRALPGAISLATGNGNLIVLGAGTTVLSTLRHHADLAQGDLVQAVGTVRMLDDATLRSQLGGNGDARRFASLRNRPAIVLRRLDLVPQLPTPQEQVRSVSLRDLTTAPSAFYGRHVSLGGRVLQRLSGSAFVLGDSDHQVLVVGSSAGGGGEATANGTVVEPSTAVLKALEKGGSVSSVLGSSGTSDLGDYDAAIVARSGGSR